MAKSKSTYVCQNCGAESSKWIGRCPSCGEWNTYVEEVTVKSSPRNVATTGNISSRPEKLKNINLQQNSNRYKKMMNSTDFLAEDSYRPIDSDRRRSRDW